MQIYQLSKIGTFHVNHNEDAISSQEIGNSKMLIAVMDGCSMGKESHFASTLIAKILRKTAREISFKAFIEKQEESLEYYLKEILRSLFTELKFIQNRLLLEQDEILSTLIIAVFDAKEKAAELMTIGDGLVCWNGNYIEYEQDDKPDYLAYHFTEDFEYWYLTQTQRLSLMDVSDLSISTDGIYSFQPFDLNKYESIEANALIDFLLIDRKWETQENMLTRKLIEIEQRFGLKSGDDLSILRVMV